MELWLVADRWLNVEARGEKLRVWEEEVAALVGWRKGCWAAGGKKVISTRRANRKNFSNVKYIA